MARNEFGVESSDGEGFGAGVGNDFEDMFEEAINVSVVDDEVSDTRRSRARRAVPEAPAAPVERQSVAEPIPDPEFNLDPEPQSFEEERSFDTGGGDVEAMFEEAESFSVADDELRETEAAQIDFESFDSFGVGDDSDSFTSFGDDNPAEAQSFESSEPESYAEDLVDEAPVAELITEPAVEPEQVYYAPTISEPTPSVVPEATSPTVAASVVEADVDYIERVILTSDAIRELPEGDAKAVNMFITAGQPVDSHQELVLTALLADRQILKTADAILEAKSKTSVDRAFHILGLDEPTFVDFGKILSHDLEATETVIFEGDRLQYARKLVDVVESLPAASIKRFEAVKSVLGAGESDS